MFTKNNHIITKIAFPGLAMIALALFGSSPALAQSSGGNFTASVDNTVCSVNSTTGGQACSGPSCILFTANGGGSLTAQIKLPNSSPGLLVTPSLVTGLYTNTLSANTAPSETAAIVVVVTDTIGSSIKTLTPNQTCVNTLTDGTQCGVAYDERFQQLITTGFTSSQSVDLILSSLSAHSFNFTEGNVPGGIHTVKVKWYFGCDNGSGTLSTAACSSAFAPNTAAACAGPGTLTVTQVQQFQHSSQIGTTGP
jgi:hypothetical protein